MVSQAVHQGLETIEQGRLPYVAVLQQKTRANRRLLVKSFCRCNKNFGCSLWAVIAIFGGGRIKTDPASAGVTALLDRLDRAFRVLPG
jgi:hypothetical protein